MEGNLQQTEALQTSHINDRHLFTFLLWPRLLTSCSFMGFSALCIQVFCPNTVAQANIKNCCEIQLNKLTAAHSLWAKHSSRCFRIIKAAKDPGVQKDPEDKTSAKGREQRCWAWRKHWFKSIFFLNFLQKSQTQLSSAPEKALYVYHLPTSGMQRG